MTEDYYWDYCNATKAGQYLYSQECLIVNEFMDNYIPKLCLDIACGSGRFSLPVMEKGIRVFSCDSDMVPIKKLSNKLLESRSKENSMGVMQSDAEHMPFKDKTFDCILSTIFLRVQQNITR